MRTDQLRILSLTTFFENNKLTSEQIGARSINLTSKQIGARRRKRYAILGDLLDAQPTKILKNREKIKIASFNRDFSEFAENRD